MREEAFRLWLEGLGTMEIRPIGDAISRCRRVSNGLSINLDDEYKKDCGRSIISLLEYTADDARNNKPVSSGLGFAPNANLKNGMASLKAAVKKYFEFCQFSK